MQAVEQYRTRDERAIDPAVQDIGGARASARRPRLRLKMDLGSDSDSSEGEDDRTTGGLARWKGGFSVGGGRRGNQGTGGTHRKLLWRDAGIEFLTGRR